MRSSSPHRNSHQFFWLVIGIVILITGLYVSVALGRSGVSFGEAMRVLAGRGSGRAELIVLSVRIPRTLAAMFCGAALSVAGLLLQSALDNTLASPGVLGVNAGAGLFVLLSAVFFPYQILTKSLFAFAGAMLSMAVIYLISVRTGISKSSLLLAGIALSSVFNAFIDVIITLVPEAVADRVAFSLGGFANVVRSQLYAAIPVILVCLVLTLFIAPDLDILLLSDETAHGLGLNVARCRRIVLILASCLAGAAVSVAGLLSFIGILVPNFVRLFVHGSTRTMAVFCMIYGAAFLVLSDTLARLLFYPYELPVGLIMSVVGAPVFVWFLVRKRKHLSTQQEGT